MAARMEVFVTAMMEIVARVIEGRKGSGMEKKGWGCGERDFTMSCGRQGSKERLGGLCRLHISNTLCLIIVLYY